MKNNTIVIKNLVGITYSVMIVVNALANILPINGVNTGQVSNSYFNLFAPAAVTFFIWGFIYLLLGAYVLYQYGLFKQTKGVNNNHIFEKIGKFFITSSIANAVWIFSWHYHFIGISVLLMLILLFCLIKIADIINKEKFSLKDRLLIWTPFSVYFGWITVATIANVTTFLVSIGWDRFGIQSEIWTVIILLVGAAIGITRMRKDKNIVYGLVLVWAYIGIWIKHTSAEGFAGQYTSVIATIVMCLVLFLIAEGSLVLRNNRKNNTKLI